MATAATGKGLCISCGKQKRVVRCEGCLQLFCFDHLSDHRQELSTQLDDIEVQRDVFRQTLTEQTSHPIKHSTEYVNSIEMNLVKLTDQLRQARQENDFNEIDLREFRQKLSKLSKALKKPGTISIQQNANSIVDNIYVNIISSQQELYSPRIDIDTKWIQNGRSIAGGNGKGNQLDQLSMPQGIYIDDDDRCIYIADKDNHRIIQWKYGANNGEVVAGGNGKGDRMNQLNGPADVMVDKNDGSLIVCDQGNRRVMRWSRQNGNSGQLVVSGINGWGLAMDSDGNLYVSDREKNEVRRWKTGETNGTVVAGGNGKGDRLNQLNYPTYIFADTDQSIYVSDCNNHRVMKWIKGAKEGIVVAGGHGQGNTLMQLSSPIGLTLDRMDNIYVADSENNRIICWMQGSEVGRIIVGGNGCGDQPDQFNYLRGLSLDREGHLYVVDRDNNRVQRFDIDLN